MQQRYTPEELRDALASLALLRATTGDGSAAHGDLARITAAMRSGELEALLKQLNDDDQDEGEGDEGERTLATALSGPPPAGLVRDLREMVAAVAPGYELSAAGDEGEASWRTVRRLEGVLSRAWQANRARRERRATTLALEPEPAPTAVVTVAAPTPAAPSTKPPCRTDYGPFFLANRLALEGRRNAVSVGDASGGGLRVLIRVDHDDPEIPAWRGRRGVQPLSRGGLLVVHEVPAGSPLLADWQAFRRPGR